MDRRLILMSLAAMAGTGPALAQMAGSTSGAMSGSMPGGMTMEMGQAEKNHAMRTGAAGAAALMVADLGLEKARGAKVKEFAKFEHDEQTTIAEILKSMDPSMSPPKPDAKMTATIDKLREMKPGPEFDRAFIQAQTDGHEVLLDIQEDYLKVGKNREVVNVTKLARGQIKEHLTLLSDLKKMG